MPKNNDTPWLVCQNRKAKYDYFLEETVEAGITLQGHEVRSIRDGKISIAESYVVVEGQKLIIRGMTIQRGINSPKDYEPTRDRSLLLHKKEIEKLTKKINEKGYTMIPLNVHRKNGLYKLDVALAKGKNVRDKREDIKTRDAQRDIRKEM